MKVGASLPFIETLERVVQVLISTTCCIKELSKTLDSSSHQLKRNEAKEDCNDFLAIQPGGSDALLQVHRASYSTCDHQARPNATGQRHTSGTVGPNVHLVYAHTSRFPI